MILSRKLGRVIAAGLVEEATTPGLCHDFFGVEPCPDTMAQYGTDQSKNVHDSECVLWWSI